MLRPATIVIYSAVFGVALLMGLMVATLLLPQSLPAASFATPTPTTEPIASVSQLMAAAPVAMPEPPTATPVPPSATAAPPTASPAAAPTSTPPPSPTATELSFPTVTPTTAATSPDATTAVPSPLTFAARVAERPTDAAIACGTSFESHIWGVVKNSAGRGIYRAVVMARSLDGKNRFSAQTNSQGGFEIPGLGCTTWIVRLASVPGAPAGVQALELRVSLNGGRYSGAGVEFRQR